MTVTVIITIWIHIWMLCSWISFLCQSQGSHLVYLCSVVWIVLEGWRLICGRKRLSCALQSWCVLVGVELVVWGCCGNIRASLLSLCQAAAQLKPVSSAVNLLFWTFFFTPLIFPSWSFSDPSVFFPVLNLFKTEGFIVKDRLKHSVCIMSRCQMD